MNASLDDATTIVLADDHAMVREGLRELLQAHGRFRIVAEASTGLEALKRVEELQPHILILDLIIPQLDGIEVTRQISRRLQTTRVIVLSMHADEAYVLKSLQAGAAAYILKSAESTRLIEAIDEVRAGRRYLSPPLTFQAIESYANHTRSGAIDLYETLTAREREVMQLAAAGHTNAAIGGLLSISPRTVEVHRAHLMKKLNLGNQAELVRYAIGKIANPSSAFES